VPELDASHDHAVSEISLDQLDLLSSIHISGPAVPQAMDSQSSSPAVQASRKRPAKVIVSDDEEDDVDQLNSTPAAVNGKGKSRASAQRKRVRSSSSISSVGGSDLDILGSGEEEEAPAKRKKGKEKANGIGRQNGNGHAGDSDEDGDEEAGPSVRRGEIGFRPEYKRGKDG
jgi:hypothetical protein